MGTKTTSSPESQSKKKTFDASDLMYSTRNDDLMLENKLDQEAADLANYEFASNKFLDYEEISKFMKKKKYDAKEVKKDSQPGTLFLHAANLLSQENKHENDKPDHNADAMDLMFEAAS